MCPTGEERVQIPIPKGASRIDISPADFAHASTESIVTSPPSSPTATSYSQAPSGGEMERKSRSATKLSSDSIYASVHIPSSVFILRAISPEIYPELIVVSPGSSPESSASNTRQNTDEMRKRGPMPMPTPMFTPAPTPAPDA